MLLLKLVMRCFYCFLLAALAFQIGPLQVDTFQPHIGARVYGGGAYGAGWPNTTSRRLNLIGIQLPDISLLGTPLMATFALHSPAALSSLTHPPINRMLQSDSGLTAGQALHFIKGYKAWDFAKFPLTTGIEVEMIMPQQHPHKVIIPLLRAQIEQSYPKARIHESGSHSRLIFEAKTKKYIYHLGAERSLQVPEKFYDLELISPIMYNKKDIMTFYKVVQILKEKMGARAIPTQGGVHVHIGFPEAKEGELALLSWLFAAVEGQVHTHFSTFKSRWPWTRPTSEEMKKLYKEKSEKYDNSADIRTKMKVDDLVQANERRLHGLNLHPLKEIETVEFRFLNSTLDTKKIKNFVLFAQALVQAVRSHDPKLIAFLKQQASQSTLSLPLLMKVLNLNFTQINFNDEVQQFYHVVSPTTLVKDVQQALVHKDDIFINTVAKAYAKHSQAQVLIEESLFMLAISKGDIKEIQKILKQGVISLKPRHLALALTDHQVGAVGFLIEQGLRPSVLQMAQVIYHDQQDMLAELIKGVSAEQGQLYDAIQNENVQDVLLLLDQDKNQAKLWHLSVAVIKGSLQIVQALIAAGVSASSSHLNLAVEHNHVEVVSALAATGLDMEPYFLKSAVTRGHMDLVQTLMKLGLSPEPVHLRVAIVHKHIQLVRLFLDAGVRCSCLSDAIELEALDVARVLMGAGYKLQEYHLTEAIQGRHWRSVRFLIEQGIRPRHRHIQLARDMGHDETVFLLKGHRHTSPGSMPSPLKARTLANKCLQYLGFKKTQIQ